MEMIYSRELGMSVVPDEVSNANQTKLSFSDALALYQRLKGTGKNNLFLKYLPEASDTSRNALVIIK